MMNQLINEIKRLVDEYNEKKESRIWIDLDQIQVIKKDYEENEYTKIISYSIYLNTIRINLIWFLDKETGNEKIDVYIINLLETYC